jgi:uncharacterized protein (DUF2141 family)
VHTLALVVWCVALSAAQPPRAGTIALEVTGLRATAGALRVKLVARPDGFPGSDEHVVAKHREAVAGTAHTIVFDDVPFGHYAVVVLHDEDDDAELDRSALGLPREGLGFSRGARVRFGPPSFEEARFELAEPHLEMPIEVHY